MEPPELDITLNESTTTSKLAGYLVAVVATVFACAFVVAGAATNPWVWPLALGWLIGMVAILVNANRSEHLYIRGRAFVLTIKGLGGQREVRFGLPPEAKTRLEFWGTPICGWAIVLDGNHGRKATFAKRCNPQRRGEILRQINRYLDDTVEFRPRVIIDAILDVRMPQNTEMAQDSPPASEPIT